MLGINQLTSNKKYSSNGFERLKETFIFNLFSEIQTVYIDNIND
jgi:hypothetical protein